MKEQLIELLAKANLYADEKLITIDIDLYVEKIEKYATIFSIFNNSKLKAFIAYYENDMNNDLAFLSMLVVDNDSRNLGLGKSLMEISIKQIEKKGFKRYGLDVDKNNVNAIRFYKKFGFAIINEKVNNFIYMEKTFKL